MAEWFSGLLPMDDEADGYLASTYRVKAINKNDFPGWEAVLLGPAKSPLPFMRAQNQRRNDCQGNATANGEEKRHWYCTGEMVQLSDTYAYNGSEYLENAVGRDQGTNMQSGVKILTEGIKVIDVAPGLPTEADWTYDTYERSKQAVARRAQQVTISSAYVSEHGPMPDFDTLLVAMAAGGSGHIGTYWPPRWSKVGQYRCMDTAPTGGGGHATEIVWALKIGGQWYLTVWNSHGDRFYLMSRRCYDQMQARQWRPFGAYLLMPDKPVERYHDRRQSGGGYY